MKIIENFLFLIFFVLFLNIGLIKSKSQCQFNRNEDLINYYVKGVIPNYNISSKEIKDYKWEFIHCINGYSQRTYIIKENGDYFSKKSGIFIGSSIDIGKLSIDFINSNLKLLNENTKNTLAKISGKFGEEAEKIYKEYGNFSLDDDQIDIINEEVYKVYLSEMKDYYNKDKIKSFSLEMCLLSFYVKFYGFDDILLLSKNHVDNEHLYLLSYFFLTLQNNNYIQNKLWSLLTISSAQPNFNYHHISFYIDSKLTKDSDQKNITQWIKSFISTTKNQDNLYTIGNFSGIILDEDKKYIYNSSIFSKILDNYHFSPEPFEIINIGLKRFENCLEYNNTIYKGKYYQRHLIIILNPPYGFGQKIYIDNLNEKGINVILLFKINTSEEYKQIEYLFDDVFNRIPLYYYQDLNNYDNYSLLINSQINFFVEPFKYNNKIIEINHIPTVKRDNWQCFKISYKDIYLNNNNNENDIKEYYYFHVSLIYNNDEEIRNKFKNNANITFFIDNNTPFADIHNYQLINFCSNNTISSDFNKSPFINYIITDKNLKNKYFYITVLANNLEYSLRIELLNTTNLNNLNISNGLFGNLQVQPMSSELISTFSDKCIQKKCDVDYISLVKYYTSGIHLKDINDDNLFNKLFDLNLFECLYKNYFCPFFKIEQKESNYKLGPYIGYGIDLSKSKEIDLYTEYIPLYIINKLYPFLMNNLNESERKETLEKYNLNLTYEELFDLNMKYLSNIFTQLNTRIKNYDLSDNIKFALFLHLIESGLIPNNTIIEELNQKKIHRYLDELMKSDLTRTITFESLNFQMLLIESIEIYKLKKCFISFVVGKSLLFSDIFIELINKFSNYRISVSYYDDEKEKTILIQYFTEDIENIKKKIKEITGKIKLVEKMKKPVDINSVLEQQYSLFKNFDYEIKKSIIIVSTHSNDTFIYDFEYPKKELLENLYEIGVNIFDYSDRINFVNSSINNNRGNNEKKTYNFYNSVKSEYIQFIPYIKYFDMCDNYISLYNIVNKYPIPITKIEDMYLDFEPDEEIIFEFDLTKEKEKLIRNNKLDKYNKIRFIFDPFNLSIYFSRNFPYPNEHSYEYKETGKSEVYFDLKFQDYNSSKFYMSIKSNKKINNILVNLELCDDSNKCMKESFYFKFYLGFTAVGILILFYGIYICFCEITFKKESNIFDIK